jgi:hypothetical protein
METEGYYDALGVCWSSSSRWEERPKSSLLTDRMPDWKTDSLSGTGAGVTSFADAIDCAGTRKGGIASAGASEVDVVVLVAALAIVGSVTLRSTSLPPDNFSLFSLSNVDSFEPPEIVDIRFLFFVDPSGRLLPLGAGHKLSD